MSEFDRAVARLRADLGSEPVRRQTYRDENRESIDSFLRLMETVSNPRWRRIALVEPDGSIDAWHVPQEQDPPLTSDFVPVERRHFDQRGLVVLKDGRLLQTDRRLGTRIDPDGAHGGERVYIGWSRVEQLRAEVVRSTEVDLADVAPLSLGRGLAAIFHDVARGADLVPNT